MYWAVVVIFDYFVEYFGYIGVDGDSMVLISYVYYEWDVINVFWNGDWVFFGDGNGISFIFLAIIDVVVYEFMYGII